MLAAGGKSHSRVIGISGFAKCAQMTAHAFGGESKTIELAYRAHLVAGIAVHRGVRTDQGKAILVLVDVVNGNLPAVCVVAKCALSAVFAPMQIRMAILALHWRAAENESLMAIPALHFCVSSAQREFGAGMVELEPGAQRLPAPGGMTLLALNFELVAVWAVKWRIQRDLLS